MRSVSAIIGVCLAVMSAACGGDAVPAAAVAAKFPKLVTGTDAGAFADLQASAEWLDPRCRWLETGAHLLAYPQDTAVLKAARDLGYIEMEQVGMGNRIGTPNPRGASR